MAELESAIYERIKRLCAEGDDLASNRRFDEALDKYLEAWDLLPTPKTDWDAASWIMAAIGDANFLSGDFAAGRNNLLLAMKCPGAIGNPFIHLRLGQCQFELGELDKAADEMSRSYMSEGPEIFVDEDSKYLEFLLGRFKA